MQKIKTFIYNFGQGIMNIHRNRMFSLAAIGTMTACLFLFGIFYFLLANFQYILKSTESTVGITVFFDDAVTGSDLEDIGNQILLRPDVVSITYVSPEETWEHYKENYLSDELAETFGDDNPLEYSASYTVYSNDVSLQTDLAEYIRGIPGVRQVNNSEEIADSLSGISTVVGYVSAVIIIILICVATFLIATTISMGISVRKEEISIMKLIGATDRFIREPYMVEGILLGLIGAAVPLLFLYAVYHRIIEYMTLKFENVFKSIQFLDIHTVFAALVPLSLLIGLGIGFLGSYVSLNRELRKIS